MTTLIGFIAISIYILAREWYDWKFRKDIKIIFRKLDADNFFRSCDIKKEIKEANIEQISVIGKELHAAVALLENQFNETEARIENEIGELKLEAKSLSDWFGSEQLLHHDLERKLEEAKEIGKKRGDELKNRVTHLEDFLLTKRVKPVSFTPDMADKFTEETIRISKQMAEF